MALNHIYLNKKTEEFVRSQKISENESDAAASARLLRELAEGTLVIVQGKGTGMSRSILSTINLSNVIREGK